MAKSSKTREFPPLPHIRPLCGRQFPLSIHGEGVADRPGVRSHSPSHVINARFAGVNSPSPFMERGAGGEVPFPHLQIYHICRRQMSFPLAIHGEGVADRPGVRSHFPISIHGEGVADRPGVRSIQYIFIYIFILY